MEQANEFYLQKKEQVMAAYHSVSHAVEAIAQARERKRERESVPARA